jgi:hypothetical protein
MWFVGNVAGVQNEYRDLVQPDTKETSEEDMDVDMRTIMKQVLK